jgi:hypothetical protein
MIGIFSRLRETGHHSARRVSSFYTFLGLADPAGSECIHQDTVDELSQKNLALRDHEKFTKRLRNPSLTGCWMPEGVSGIFFTGIFPENPVNIFFYVQKDEYKMYFPILFHHPATIHFSVPEKS